MATLAQAAIVIGVLSALVATITVFRIEMDNGTRSAEYINKLEARNRPKWCTIGVCLALALVSIIPGSRYIYNSNTNRMLKAAQVAAVHWPEGRISELDVRGSRFVYTNQNRICTGTLHYRDGRAFLTPDPNNCVS